MIRRIAIDPGLSGGIAIWDGPKGVAAVNMPDTPADILHFLMDLTRDGQVTCLMENVGGTRPGNSAKSARTFAIHQGHLEMALLAAEIPVRKVTPSKWMNHLLPSLPADKTARKNAIKAKVQERFPGIKVTLATADALGILCYELDGKA